MSAYQPKTGARCSCRPGQARDNCPRCEGTGWEIDFAAIRALRTGKGRDAHGLLPWPEEPEESPAPEAPGADTTLAAAMELLAGPGPLPAEDRAEVFKLIFAARRQVRVGVRGIVRLAESLERKAARQ